MDGLLVHVGYHKTGSTWLQRRLFADPACFVRAARRREIVARLVLADDLAFDVGATRDFFAAELETRRAGAGTDGAVPVLSHERLSGNPHSGGYDSRVVADRLARVLPSARILLVVREQRSMLLSCWKQYVRVGGASSLRRYVTPPLRGDARVPLFQLRYLEYDRLVRHYHALFGADRVLVLPFERLVEDQAAFAAAVCAFAGARPPGPLPAAREHAALSGVACGLKRRMNLLLVRDTVNPSAPVELPGLNRRAVRAFEALDRRLPGAARRAWEARLRRQAHGLVSGRFAASNRRTAQLTGLDLARYGYDC